MTETVEVYFKQKIWSDRFRYSCHNNTRLINVIMVKIPLSDWRSVIY